MSHIGSTRRSREQEDASAAETGLAARPSSSIVMGEMGLRERPLGIVVHTSSSGSSPRIRARARTWHRARTGVREPFQSTATELVRSLLTLEKREHLSCCA